MEIVEDLISTPNITWSWETEPLDIDGSGGGVSINGSGDGPLLEFNPLMASDRGVYRCDVSIQVSAINLSLNASREIFIGTYYANIQYRLYLVYVRCHTIHITRKFTTFKSNL